MKTAWIRVSRSCQNACLFCAEKAHLDGAPVPLEAITFDIDAAVLDGATRVVLSGGEPTLNKALLGAIRHAKARGLRVAMTTNGRVLQTEKHIEVLKNAGLDEIAVSIHSGRKAVHDTVVGREGAWVESLQALRVAGRGGLHTTLKVVLTQGNDDDLDHLQHLGTMAGIKSMELRLVEPLGAAASTERFSQLAMTPMVALRHVEELWVSAKEEVTRLTTVGLDDTVDLALTAAGKRQQADTSALGLLRKRVLLASAGAGFSVLDADSMGKDLVGLADGAGGLAEAGLELAAWGAPLVDGPWCVGGRSEGPPAQGEEPHHEGEACLACPMRPNCVLLPKKLGKIAGGQLAPLPTWSTAEGPITIVLPNAGDTLLHEAFVDAAQALIARGAQASVVPAGSPIAPGLALVGDAAGLAAARAAGFSGRAVVLDAGPLAELRSLQAEDVVESSLPGRVDRFVGVVSLRQVRWTGWPVPRRVAEAELSEDGGVLHLGAALPEGEALVAAVLAARVVTLEGRGPLEPEAMRALTVALAAGRPVVAVRRPGLEDLVRHEVNGLLVPSTGGAAVREIARRLLVDPTNLRRLAVGARHVAKASSPEALADRLLHGVRPEVRGPASGDRRYPTW